DDDRGEIGAIARVIRSFFEQREAMVREMSARRQAERELQNTQEQLRHSQKIEAVGRLAGGVAHDYNNCLTTIIGYGLMLQERFATRDTAARDELEEILKASYRAATLTRQLLAFSQKQTLYPRTTNLNELVRRMEPTLRRLAGPRIELRVEADAPQSTVRVDRAQMEQVLFNLAANAHDAMPQGGILTISTADTLIPEPIQQHGIELPAGTYVTLEVRDTGGGIDEATRGRMFEPFFTTKPAGEATGLSLAAVYGTVQQSGGAIAIQSSPGKGAGFLVHLPLVPDGVASVEPDRSFPTPERLPEGETVLVVENDPGVRRLISTVLKKQGMNVLVGEDAASARAHEAENPGKIRLLLTNLVLRGGNGMELADEFRLRQPEMEVLFIGGYPESHDAEKELPGDNDLILAKPFTPGVLIDRVARIFSRQKAT
ncbi:MAG: response regulator, partial [Verrucomicrobiaceae bacterium]